MIDSWVGEECLGSSHARANRQSACRLLARASCRRAKPLLPQRRAIAQGLRLNSASNLLRLNYQVIQLLAGADIEMPEALKELVQIRDRRIPEHFGFAVFLTAQMFRQMTDHLGEFIEERL